MYSCYTNFVTYHDTPIPWGSMVLTTPWSPCPIHVPLLIPFEFTYIRSFTLRFILSHLCSDAFTFLLFVSHSLNVVGKLQTSETFQFSSLDCLTLVVMELLQSFFCVCVFTNISFLSLLLSLCALLWMYEIFYVSPLSSSSRVTLFIWKGHCKTMWSKCTHSTTYSTNPTNHN
jgi:hypothetical protein